MSSLPVRFVTASDGTTIAYCRHGAGAPIVLARGWVTHLELQWDDVAFRRFFEPLTRHAELIRFDTRGNGLSDRDVAPIDLDALVADLEAVMDGLALERVTLWGSVFGGPVAIAYASRHPDRVERLVLDGTYARGTDLGPLELWDEWLQGLRSLRLMPEALFASISYMTDPEPGTSHATRVERLRRSIKVDTVLALNELAPRLDVADLLPTLAVPTLVLHRRRTRALPFVVGRRLAAMIPGAEFVALEGTAHNVWEERPDDALGPVGHFLGIEGLEAVTGSSPSTPVAVLFTDVVESTALTGALGDRGAHELVRRHNEVVRRALDEFAGREVKHTGDGIMASFRSVAQAVACAVTIHDTLTREGGPAIHVGLNAGEPLSEDDDLFGTVVQLASRACSAAQPGETLVTNVVRELTAGKGFAYQDAGEHRLKGFDEPVRLWRVSAPR